MGSNSAGLSLLLALHIVSHPKVYMRIRLLYLRNRSLRGTSDRLFEGGGARYDSSGPPCSDSSGTMKESDKVSACPVYDIKIGLDCVPSSSRLVARRRPPGYC